MYALRAQYTRSFAIRLYWGVGSEALFERTRLWVGDGEESVFVSGKGAGGADLVVDIEKSEDVADGDEDADDDDERSP